MEKIFGIIGRPLEHSFSQRFFTAKFSNLASAGHSYLNFELESIAELPRILADYRGLRGFNVTIPYKKEVIPWLDTVSDEAHEIGAVNCVKISGGKLHGHNTDAYGFKAGLEKLLGVAPGGTGLQALVLGTGGASCAVRYVLESVGVGYKMISRTGGGKILSYAGLTPGIVESHKLIINTTPLGTFPNVDEKPGIPYEGVGSGHFLYDLVYNPAETAFLKEGLRRGAKTLNGETMLYAQAEKSWDIWNSPNQSITL